MPQVSRWVQPSWSPLSHSLYFIDFVKLTSKGSSRIRIGVFDIPEDLFEATLLPVDDRLCALGWASFQVGFSEHVLKINHIDRAGLSEVKDPEQPLDLHPQSVGIDTESVSEEVGKVTESNDAIEICVYHFKALTKGHSLSHDPIDNPSDHSLFPLEAVLRRFIHIEQSKTHFISIDNSLELVVPDEANPEPVHLREQLFLRLRRDGQQRGQHPRECRESYQTQTVRVKQGEGLRQGQRFRRQYLSQFGKYL